MCITDEWLYNVERQLVIPVNWYCSKPHSIYRVKYLVIFHLSLSHHFLSSWSAVKELQVLLLSAACSSECGQHVMSCHVFCQCQCTCLTPCGEAAVVSRFV